MSWYNNCKFSDLEGKILTKIIGDKGSDKLIFITSDGEHYKMYHRQCCCENVSIDDIIGDLNDLIGTPIITASEDSNSDKSQEQIDEEKNRGWVSESFTWTFYNIATIKGYVTIRWFGESNGYYSESCDFEKITKGDNAE
jgi:hypothetical protein